MPRAATRNAMRNSEPESRGSCASCCAMPTWKGLMGLNAAPTAAADRGEGWEGAYRLWRDRVVRAGHHDAAAGGGIVAPVVLAGWQHMTRQGGDQHAADEQRQGVGEPHAGIMPPDGPSG